MDENLFPEGKRLVFAVWIRGKGWLKKDESDSRTTFVDYSRDVAEAAAELWGNGAQVFPFDQSLLDLESVFLARDRDRAARKGFGAWLNGILG